MTSLVILTNLIKLSSQEKVGSLFITSHLSDYLTGGLGEEAAERQELSRYPTSHRRVYWAGEKANTQLGTLQLCIKRSQFSGTSGQTWEEASSVGSFRHNLQLGQDHGAADHTGGFGEQENHTAEQVFEQGMSIFTRL